ncbi:hypothetical protein GQ600_15273 [Phytophthora cactorum]|nr:hypothetical protein GQ600_15273 [Phytophthora cactorum]
MRVAAGETRHFYTLKHTRKSTGDPSCLADVAQAKRVYRLIECRCGRLLLDDSADQEAPGGSSDGDIPTSEPTVTSLGPEATVIQTPSATADANASNSNPESTHAYVARISRTAKTLDELEQLGRHIQAGTKESLSESARKRQGFWESSTT